MKVLKFSVFLGLLFGCGGPLMKDVAPSDSTEGGSQSLNEKIRIDVVVSENKSSLLLADATAFTMQLDGCASGYTSSATETDPSLLAYKFDRNCLAKLASFQINGITYVPSAADPFTTWLAGDTAVFEDSTAPTNLISVKVVTQLDNPISGTEPIAYSFSQISKGDDENIADSVVGDSHTMSVSGLGAPSFTISAVNYVGISATGAGEFVFTLDCTVNTTGTGATTACLDAEFDKLRYKLVKDTYGSVLTIADAQALFPTDESSINVATDIIAVGGATAPNGGFVTGSGANVLKGPDQMHLNPNMILIIESADLSYTYYNIDVSTLVQP